MVCLRSGRRASGDGAKVTLLIVRPHRAQIRERVLALLARLGIDTDDPTILPPGTSDDEALRAMRRDRPSALLIPLHAHRDKQGRLLNGLGLAQRIDEQFPDQVDMPIFMPASPMGMATLELALARAPGDGGLSPRLRRRLVPVPLDSLDDIGLVTAITKTLRALSG